MTQYPRFNGSCTHTRTRTRTRTRFSGVCMVMFAVLLLVLCQYVLVAEADIYIFPNTEVVFGCVLCVFHVFVWCVFVIYYSYVYVPLTQRIHAHAHAHTHTHTHTTHYRYNTQLYRGSLVARHRSMYTGNGPSYIKFDCMIFNCQLLLCYVVCLLCVCLLVCVCAYVCMCVCVCVYVCVYVYVWMCSFFHSSQTISAHNRIRSNTCVRRTEFRQDWRAFRT